MRQGNVMTRSLTSCAIALVLLSLAGCDVATRDSWEDAGTWRPTGANQTNLQAMVANPDDLNIGRGERGGSAIIATTAVNRVLTDKIKPLPVAGTLTFGGGTSSSAGGGQAVAPQ